MVCGVAEAWRRVVVVAVAAKAGVGFRRRVHLRTYRTVTMTIRTGLDQD